MKCFVSIMKEKKKNASQAFFLDRTMRCDVRGWWSGGGAYVLYVNVPQWQSVHDVSALHAYGRFILLLLKLRASIVHGKQMI